MKGDELVRMTPSKDGGANEGHSCVKGRFAWGYATHQERITVPMVRESVTDAWRETSWDEAISYAVDKFKAVQQQYGVDYQRYWVDEAQGKIFCLVDAPDAEAANTVHREAHGLVADEIYPVREGV
jgi:anaerobic selenocysteine-containing dehydrogenase